MVARYVYTPASSSSQATSTLTFVHTSYLGTPVLETDQKGDIVYIALTDINGNAILRDERNDSTLQNKLYTGHRYDNVTGLTYAHARYLDTRTHTFTTVDPLYYQLSSAQLYNPQLMNAYSYANNNPVSNTDPTGLWSIASAWSSVKSFASAAVATVKSYTNTVVTGIKSAGASASSLVSSAATYVSGKVNTAVSKTTIAISNGYASMGNTLTNVGSYITGTSAGIYNQVIASPINLGLNPASQGAELVRNTPTNIQIPVVQPGGDSSFNSGLTAGNVIGLVGAVLYGGGAKAGASMMESKTGSFFQGTSYSGAVINKMQNDIMHGFPKLVEGFEATGVQTSVKGGDGLIYNMLKISGSVNGKNGFYEFIKDSEDIITHRFFRITR